jgi:hypothetical protein
MDIRDWSFSCAMAMWVSPPVPRERASQWRWSARSGTIGSIKRFVREIAAEE